MIRITLRFFSILFAVCFLQAGYAQQFGGNPPSIKWKQVNTPTAKVIFPVGLDSAAMRVANIVQNMNSVIQPSIGFKQRQISIVLQNQTTVSNAYVGLAPFRSEFYLTPEQNNFDIGSLPWPEQLAIHEFRHVQQYNNFNTGGSRVLKVLFGESGQALGNALSVPNWFFEGDAVFNETLVSQQGRGRLPYFFNSYRGLWDAGKDYSWMKLRNGSYVDYIPDWYPLGYMEIAYGRQRYGKYFWKNVTHDAAGYKSLFYPFQHAIKRYSGLSFPQFRDSALTYFKNEFGQLPDRAASQNKSPKRNQHFIANEQFPAFIDDGTIIYLRSDYKHRTAFVLRQGDNETRIRVQDLTLDGYFDYHNGYIVYAGYRSDLRWSYRDYSELKLLDVKTGTERCLTSRSKYFSPAFSADGKSIVAVEEAPSGQSRLHILDAATGKLITKIPNPEGVFYTYPKFYDNDKIVSAVRRNDGRITIALVDRTTGTTTSLLEPSFAPVGFPALRGDTLYFSRTRKLNDELYALNLRDRRLYHLTNDSLAGGIGNYQVAVSDHKLAWVSFTAFGYKLHQADQNNIEWQEITGQTLPGLTDVGVTVLKKDSATNLLGKMSFNSLPVKKYPKFYHPFNFHSVIPDFEDPNYSVALEGQNVLNTFQSEVAFNYNRDEGYKEISANAIYGALFPYISAGANYTLDRRGIYKGNNVYWNETAVHAGLEVPFNFISGLHNTGLAIGSDIYYNSTSFQQPFRSTFRDRSYAYVNNYINFTNRIAQPLQNIYPRFAQSISLNFKQAVVNSSDAQFLANGTFYFPGLFINHNLVINVAHQQKTQNSVISYSNNFPFSRGYTVENFNRMNKIAINYHFPIAYPDAGIANLVYLHRLRGNVYFDYTRVNDYYTNNMPFKADFRTVGAELWFDTQWFNQEPITFGLRYVHLLDPDTFGGLSPNRVELVVPLTLF